MTKRLLDIVTNVMVIIIAIIMMAGEVLGIRIGYVFHNYLFLASITFIWIKFIREAFFGDKISKVVLATKYPYTTKSVVRFTMIITFILSWWSVISFIIFIIMSYYYIEFGKLKELKEKMT